MKHFPYLSSVLFILCLLLMQSCTNKGGPIVSKEVAYKDCSKHCDFEVDGSFEIDKKCAKCMQKNFALNNYNFPQANPDSLNVRGFAIYDKEIMALFDQILLNSGTGVQINLFAMLGIYYGPVPKDTLFYETISHQIFTLERVDSNTNDTTYQYFDFIRPCPNYCPGQGDGSGDFPL